MTMDNTLPNISQRLREVNTFLATFGQGGITFGQALPPSRFYWDFRDTNRIVTEADSMRRDDADRLMNISSSLFSGAETYLSIDKTPLQPAGFETLFE